MEHSLWETNSSIATWADRALLGTARFITVLKSLPLFRPLGHINPVHAHRPCFLKKHFNTFLLAFLQVSLPKSSMPFSSHHMCHKPLPSRPLWFDHLNSTWWGLQILKLLIIPVCCSFLLRPNISLSTLFPNILCSYPVMWDTKFHTDIK